MRAYIQKGIGKKVMSQFRKFGMLYLNKMCDCGISTDPPHRHPKPQTKQSSGNNKKEIITKHDSTVCGRRNVKIMEKVRSNSK